MYRHVITHRQHFAVCFVDRARIVAPLLDVGRKGRAPQRCAHFLCRGMEEILENLQAGRVNAHRFAS